ncbi:hypothetical protein AVEN_54629-1 [Araneus ventricosus]|uniref:Integrase zinc-binding domain-containing protein n=1 Tax=Araneus ventricosus TaxID=182803 RepID=A0A4Y2BL58_ARAVE|nr:hypothetical protein AVEN_54629-1 [Araneus ventricosus]
MNLAFIECPQDVRESLAPQFFVVAIRDTQLSTRLMELKELKSVLAYSMKSTILARNNSGESCNKTILDSYLKWESDDGSSCRWQLILPKSRIQEVLSDTRDRANGGHFGVMKTVRKTWKRFYWTDFAPSDVEKWCRECKLADPENDPK